MEFSILENIKYRTCATTYNPRFVYFQKQSPDFFKDVSFHVSFHFKFGNMGCCDFSNNNPRNTCLVT